MNKFKGTKGNWVVVEYDNDLEIANSLEDLVCSIPIKNEMYSANAKLIAAAPEMLEILSICLGDYKTKIVQSSARDSRIEQIENLIKKATE